MKKRFEMDDGTNLLFKPPHTRSILLNSLLGRVLRLVPAAASASAAARRPLGRRPLGATPRALALFYFFSEPTPCTRVTPRHPQIGA